MPYHVNINVCSSDSACLFLADLKKKNLIDIPGIEGSEMLYTPGLSLFDYLVLQANLLMIIKAALYVCLSIHR